MKYPKHATQGILCSRKFYPERIRLRPMTEPSLGSPPPASTPNTREAALPALEDFAPVALQLGYRLGELRQQIAALAANTQDHMIVPWTIVSDVFQTPPSLDRSSILAYQQLGAAWMRRFTRLLDEVDLHLPRPAAATPSAEFLRVMRSVGNALGEEGGFGTRLLQQMLFHKDALPPLTAAIEKAQRGA